MLFILTMCMLTKNTQSNFTCTPGGGKKSTFSLYETMDEIYKLISQQDVNNNALIRGYAKDLEKCKDKFCALYAGEPERLFDSLFYFLNHNFKDITHGKFYNTASNISYEEYAQQNITDQFLNNMIRPDGNKKEAIGGDCIHWAILLKKFIDSRKIEGLRSCLIKYKDGPHTFVLINFDNKTYRAEIAGRSNVFITELDEHIMLDRDISLLDNVKIIAESRGKKTTLTQRFFDKNGQLHYIILDKDEMVIGLNGDELCLKLDNINSKSLQTFDSQEIIDYLINHSRILFEKRKQKDIENILAMTQGIGYTINRQRLLDLFE